MNARDVFIPVAPDRWLLLRGVFPLTAEEWELAMNMLAKMKPGLVQELASPAAEKEK